MIANKEPIVLDGGANNVFVGPNKHFSIVIDEFDGKTVNAWHFEDADGNKSPNLASFAKGHNIDLLANLENKTISPFALRQSLNMLYTDLEEQGMVMTR